MPRAAPVTSATLPATSNDGVTSPLASSGVLMLGEQLGRLDATEPPAVVYTNLARLIILISKFAEVVSAPGMPTAPRVNEDGRWSGLARPDRVATIETRGGDTHA